MILVKLELKELKRCAGKQFEEGLVDVFIKLVDADLC